MANNRYTEEFKLSVVNEYFDGELGVRTLAKKYKLPSKNYITIWINEMKKAGKIPIAKKVIKNTKVKSNDNSKTAYEKELEKRIIKLEAELAIVNEYKKIIKTSKKK